MKTCKILICAFTAILVSSCGTKEKPAPKFSLRKPMPESEINIPIDKGFSEYITGYTSGIISVNSSIQIRFTPEFAAKAGKKIPEGLFVFEPAIRGKAEWTDDVTLTFRPQKILDPGTFYSGKLFLEKLSGVKENLAVFPLRIQTIKKDFLVIPGELESSEDGNKYMFHGEIITSDYIHSKEVESYLQARLGRKKLNIAWDHSDMLDHRFTITDIERKDKEQKVDLEWSGSRSGVSQRGSETIDIPATGEFSVIDVITSKGENQGIDVVFSDPIDQSQETEGLFWLKPAADLKLNIKANIVSLIPRSRQEGVVELNIDPSVRGNNGKSLNSPFTRKLNFSPVPPAIKLIGNGVILPASKNLIFPFRAVNLRAVDLKIIKIFENNLPHFLQENEINTGYAVKRFGRPVYSGRIDLVTPPDGNKGEWNMYTVDLADYIKIEPGILYKAELSMRPSYSLYPCRGSDDFARYEEMLNESEEKSRQYWDDPENYYEDSDDFIFYSMGFDWRERDNPCRISYYNPERKVTKNILASNFGIIAKKGADNILHVIVNDLLTALPLNEVQIDVYDYQLQKIISGKTDPKGTLALYCERKPFLIVAGKDKDRNYLKINDGASLSVSSFDVSGNKPENGIKAFIYGERDVWRPGDSIYLSVFIKDMTGSLPPDHPVHFELFNPLEQRIDNQISKPGSSSLVVFRTATPPEAVTGNYKAQVQIGGAIFTKRIRIETVKPNRLRINLAFPADILDNKDNEGRLDVKWLNGAAAGNLKASVEYILKPARTGFDKYRQYNFDDPAIPFNSETIKMFDGNINDKGEAAVHFNPGREITAPGMLDAVFTAKVSEQGGDESIIQTSYKFAPYPVFVGINIPGLKGNDRMLYTDRDNEAKIVTVDLNGKPVNSEVEVNLYKISYRWWWESDQEDLASFVSNSSYKPYLSKKIRTSNGEGSFTFNIGRNDWGRYLIRASVSEGHSTGKILLIDWPWDYGMKGNMEGATQLAISADREKYKPGDEIKLTFPAPENSRAIITFENSASVLDVMAVNTTKGNTVVTFKAKPEMSPNIYAYVTVIQPHSQTVNDMPVRLYGVIPLMIENPDTRLKPVIEMPDKLHSGKDFEIRIRESSKKPMSYTLAVVDEGLLDITGFRTPDPWNYFFAREALGVQTWDLYDYVLGAFGGTLDRILATGGDETVIDRTASKAERFKPVVRFFGPYNLGPGKTGIHSVILPQYTGSVRVMVVAGNNKAFGSSEKSVPVSDPLMILATAPRVVSPGEKINLPFTVFIQKNDIKTVAVTAESNDLISFEEKIKSISSSGAGEKNAEFVFMVGERTGVAKIKLTAAGGGESAVYEMEPDVRSPNPPETRSQFKLLRGGEEWETTFSPFGIQGTNKASVEVSQLPSVNLEKRLDFLLEYPHGCTEQIISSAFPQLWIKDLAGNQTGLSKNASENITEAISRITTRQMSNGGVALWPGNYQPDDWVTSYAGHFMEEAERMGYSIPMAFKNKWVVYQKKMSGEWRYDPAFRETANDQAYRLFSLALAGDPDRGAMNRLRETKGIPLLSKLFLSAAFAIAGRPEVAGDLLDMRNLEPEKEFSSTYYGSELRDKAIILYTLSILKKEAEAHNLFTSICEDLNNDTWYSTQSTAWGLLAYMKYIKDIPAGSSVSSKVTISINGEKTENVVSSGDVLISNLKEQSGTNTLVISNASDKPLNVNLVRSGIPMVSDQNAAESGLAMKVEYVNTELKPVDQKNMEQGTDFMMLAKITNNTFDRVENIALVEMVPSGWEIRNTRLFEANYGIKESTFDYRDFRDDRVNTYFSLNRGETRTFVILLNAAYKGEFFQPSVWCEAMYTDNCYSRIPGGTVKISGRKIE